MLQFSANACKHVYHATHPEQDDAVYQIHHQTEKEFEHNKNLEASQNTVALCLGVSVRRSVLESMCHAQSVTRVQSADDLN